MENNRRDFFKAVGAVTASAMFAAPRAAEAAGAAERYVFAYRHALIFDGAAPDEILSFDGGDIRGVVFRDAVPQSDGVVEKHLTNIGYEDLTISLGASQLPGLYAWIQATLDRTPQPKDGFIVSADAKGNPRTQILFGNGRITDLAFPALDSLHRAPAQISLTFEPERLKLSEPATTTTKIGGTKQKAWQCSNFRLKLSGLEQSCARVTRIDSISAQQSFNYPGFDSGESVRKNPLQVSDLVLYCPEEFAGQFRAWQRDFLINGNRIEKTGTLEFLAPDLKTVYFTLSFTGLGIFGCGLVGEDMKTSINRLVKVEMYCETVSLTVGAISTT